jgi:hypothetical protein
VREHGVRDGGVVGIITEKRNVALVEVLHVEWFRDIFFVDSGAPLSCRNAILQARRIRRAAEEGLVTYKKSMLGVEAGCVGAPSRMAELERECQRKKRQ